jgi:3',5'-cyclic AMP phosphodiesterase CpdA
MSTLTWLHLSDLHFRATHAYDENIVLQALLRDVTDRIQQDGLRPDFVAVSGDIAFSGQPAEYELARRFFDDLLATTGLGKDRLFLVPGNHDVDRSRISPGARAIGDSLADRETAGAVLASPGVAS